MCEKYQNPEYTGSYIKSKTESDLMEKAETDEKSIFGAKLKTAASEAASDAASGGIKLAPLPLLKFYDKIPGLYGKLQRSISCCTQVSS